MRYETAVPIGNGATGEVFEAWDALLGRKVALKLLLRDDPESLQRMLREAELQSRVDHPNVCRVHEVGELDGRPMIAMQLIRGEPLDEACARLELRSRIELIRAVADAVHAAHQVGLIHRDLKPGNILVECAADGTRKPVVLDFGVAREVRSPGLTHTGQLVGTPAYMSPEQAAGKIHGLDRRSDVYALGVLLYTVVTGRHPHADDSVMKTLLNIIERPLPGWHRQGVPRDLVAIIEKSLEKAPDDRYPTAAALAQDLSRFLDGAVISARAHGPVHRWRARARQNPIVTGAILVTGVIGLLAGFTTWQSQREASARAAVARELGQRVERSETIMRLAHLSPLHDLSSARREVEAESQAIRAIIARRPSISEGLGQYALGVSAARLGNLEQARSLLDEAWASGYREPRVARAIGEVLARLYHERLAEIERLAVTDGRDELVADARRRYAEPAQLLLMDAELNAADVAEVRYVQALIAAVNDDLDAAVRHGVESAATTPWFYDGLLLAAEARLRVAAGVRGEDDRFQQALGDARTYLDSVLAIAPADPRGHRALCRSWRLELVAGTGDPARLAEPAVAACRRALVADPGHLPTLDELAEVGWRAGFALVDGGKDGESWLSVAEHAANLMLAQAPAYHGALVHLGNVTYARGLAQYNAGDDPVPTYLAAVQLFRRASAIAPGDALVILGLGEALERLAFAQARLAPDFQQYFSQAEVELDRVAATAGPYQARALAMQARALSNWAYLRARAGGAPGDLYERAIAAAEAALTIDPRREDALNSLVLAYWGLADWRWILGEDVSADYDRTAALLLEAARRDPAAPNIAVNRAHVLVEQAERSSGEPGARLAILVDAESVLERVRDVYPPDHAFIETKLHIVRADLSLQSGDDNAARKAFRAAVAAVDRLPAIEGERQDSLVLSARVRRGLAASRLFDAAETLHAVNEARNAALAALQLTPGHPDALAELFRLQQIRVEGAGPHAFRTDEARLLQLADAARQRPDLAREFEALLQLGQ